MVTVADGGEGMMVVSGELQHNTTNNNMDANATGSVMPSSNLYTALTTSNNNNASSLNGIYNSITTGNSNNIITLPSHTNHHMDHTATTWAPQQTSTSTNHRQKLKARKSFLSAKRKAKVQVNMMPRM